jgi:protein-tyrosine-phosphatase
MTKTNKSSNTSNIFRRIKKKLGSPKPDHSLSTEPGLDFDSLNGSSLYQTPYYSAEQTNILFLSKRGLSRAPLAREIMRHLLHLSDHFGSIRPSARGISDAYEFCPFDKRMVHTAKKFGYELAGSSRRVNMGELSSANLIVSLDKESEEYTKSRKFYIRGQVRPIGMFLPAGDSPYIADPFDRDESTDANSNYENIVRTLEFGCGKLLKFLPSLV